MELRASEKNGGSNENKQLNLGKKNRLIHHAYFRP